MRWEIDTAIFTLFAVWFISVVYRILKNRNLRSKVSNTDWKKESNEAFPESSRMRKEMLFGIILFVGLYFFNHFFHTRDYFGYRECLGDLNGHSKPGEIYIEEVCKAFVLEKRMLGGKKKLPKWKGKLQFYL